MLLWPVYLCKWQDLVLMLSMQKMYNVMIIWSIIWTTTLWLTIFHKYAKIFCTNQRNVVTESIAMEFLFPRYDVQNKRGTTTEPCEHTFGGLHRYEREFTMYHLLQLVEKLHQKTRDMYESNLKGSRLRTIAKGYQGTHDKIFEATTKWSLRSRYSETVLINNNSPCID